ncbi:hypothetical protein Hanom_Chr06g00522401 [Helianthus anomalus]
MRSLEKKDTINEPTIYQQGVVVSIEVSNAEVVAVWKGNNDSTVTQLISTGDLFFHKVVIWRW